MAGLIGIAGGKIGKESKMNADEVVSALRCCNRSKGHRCSECPVFSRYEHRICKATVDRFAADLIESLQAQLAASQPENKPLVRCGECAKYQSPNCAAKHEQALMDFCSHGERKPERSEG